MGTTPGFRLRVPAAADASAIARVHVATWRATYGHLIAESFFDDDALRRRETMWRAILVGQDSARRLVVAEVDGAIVGFAHAGSPLGAHPVRGLQLYTLYVLPAHHGSGVGQALLDAVLGDEAAELWVARDNPRALGFYRRNGFGPDGATADDAATGLAGLRLVR